MCSTARDIKVCMTDLMWFGEEDILDAMLFEPLDDWQLASPTPEEVIMLLSELQESQAAAVYPPMCKDSASEPKNTTKLMGTVAEPQTCECFHYHWDFNHCCLRKMSHWFGFPIWMDPGVPWCQLVLWASSFIKLRWWITLSVSTRLTVLGHCAHICPITDPRSLSCESWSEYSTQNFVVRNED